MFTHKCLLATTLAAVLLAACNKNDPTDESDDPTPGTITLTTDWSRMGDGLTVPDSYTVRVGDYSATVTGPTNTIDNEFVAGSYHANIYNTAEHISINSATATVEASAAPPGASGAFIYGLPGWFFTAALDVTIEEGAQHTFTAIMQQEVQALTFTISPSDDVSAKVESITATLGGLAGAMDIDTRKRSASSSIAMAFTKQADGSWSATIRLLGIVGNSQPMTTTVSFIDGEPADITDTVDIHEAIKDSFTDDGTPDNPGGVEIELGTEIINTPTGPGFTATIHGWTVLTDKINMQ